jgi:hypothetical protein
MIQPGATRIGYKITEYSAENNSLGFSCGDGFTQPTGGCLADPVCSGEIALATVAACVSGARRGGRAGRMQVSRSLGDHVTNGQPLQNWTWLCAHYYPNLQLVQGSPLTTNDYVQVQGIGELVRAPMRGWQHQHGHELSVGCDQSFRSERPDHRRPGARHQRWRSVTPGGACNGLMRAPPSAGCRKTGWSESRCRSTPPVLAIPNVTIAEGSALTFTNNATASTNAEALLTDFESFASGTSGGTVLFRNPNFSGPTAVFWMPRPTRPP